VPCGPGYSTGIVRWMPCHWPMKTRLMRSLTTADPSSPIKMASWKSAIRQLWAKRGTVRVARQTRTRSLDRKALAFSRTAAQECSPRRKPWISSRRRSSPVGAKEPFRIDNSWAAVSHRPFAPQWGSRGRRSRTHGLRRGLHSLRRFAVQKSLELHRHRLAIRGSDFEELALLEAEHSGENVRRERLNLRIQVAHHRVVVAARVLDRVFGLAE
jgi:hypothetical protein